MSMGLSHGIPKFLCPSLSRAVRTQIRRVPSRRTKDPLVQNIDKLEAYVKTLQKEVKRKAVDHQKLQQLEDDGDFAEEEMTAMYAALTNKKVAALEAPRDRLPEKLSRLMSLEHRARAEDVDWDAAMSSLDKSGKLGSLKTFEINTIMKTMPHSSRVTHGEHLLANMNAKPNNLTFDLLMDSYASCCQVDKALHTFDRLRTSGLTPTIYSYAHLMKAFALTKDMPKASAMYKHMQEQGIEPNLVIYTSMIAACIRTNHLTQAFSIFDNLKYRSTSSAPDAQTYSLMIHACALDSDRSAERAADLFQEMTERGLKPTRETFNSLIHVYSTRKDYFAEAWRISELMQNNGVEMDKVTWHSLLSTCIVNRDIQKARTLVRELMRIGTTLHAWAPDAITFQLLFRAYANAKVKRSKIPKRLVVSTSQIDVTKDVDLWSREEPFTSDALLAESARILNHVLENCRSIVNTQLIDTYMTISKNFEAPDRFKNDWQTLYTSGLNKGVFSFEIGLAAAYTFKDWDLLCEVWTERTEWRAKQASSEPGRGNSPLNQTDPFRDFEATRLYIEALSRLNRSQLASKVLRDARSRFTFEKKDLKCYQTKSIQVGDEDAVMLYREMFPDQSWSPRQDRYY